MSPGIIPAFSLVRAHAPDFDPLTASVLPLHPESLQVAARPCWKEALPGVISANLSPGAWTLIPALPMVHLPFLPMGHRPSPFPKQVGMPHKSRATTSARRLFSGLQSFAHVQAPGFARHPGRSHRRSGSLDPIRGRRDFYVHAYLGSLPHRAVDMLAVRIEQLTAEGLSPSKIRGLAGCS